MSDISNFRTKLAIWLESPKIRYFILGVIILNAILLGMETSSVIMGAIGPLILILDTICLGIFIIEIALKLIAFGWRFFLNPWNLFDFIIVGISLAPSSGGLTVLRALRILRVLRVISIAPSLRRVVEGFITALPGMASVVLLMGILFYIGSVMSTKLFGETFPQWFGSLGESAYSLFQIMTLESWSMGIVRPVMELHPQAWMFFVPFILVTTFAVVNLLVGLIVNSMQDAHHAEDNALTDAYRDDVLQKLTQIEARLDALSAASDEAPKTPKP